MGEVWSAWHRFTHRDFAIKLLLPELASHQEALGRFFQEAQATGQLSHPSIVEVYDVGQAADGRPFLVLELLEGESLEQRLARETLLETLEVCLIFSQVAQALKLAHERGIVHRDLSTANIFLANQTSGAPLPKILDFGVSKNLRPNYERKIRTGSGAVLGSPDYMSPEQAGGAGDVDGRTDIWALGVQMYEALSGQCPFRAANYNALMIDIMTRPHRPLIGAMPGINPELAEIVDACLEKDREHRLDSAASLAERLELLAVQLAEQRGLERPGPRRRLTDRLSLNAEPPRTSLLPLSAPRGTASVGALPRSSDHVEFCAKTTQKRHVGRGARALAALARSRAVLAAGSALGGTLLGMALSAGSGASPGDASAQREDSAALGSDEVLSETGPLVTPVEAADVSASDVSGGLVEAMAKGLGLDRRLTPAQAAQGRAPGKAGAQPSRSKGAADVHKGSRRRAAKGRVALRKNPY